MKLQESDTLTAQLENLAQLQKMLIVQSIPDSEERAKLYKKVFGDCCDVPQTGCNCGCGGDCGCNKNEKIDTPSE